MKLSFNFKKKISNKLYIKMNSYQIKSSIGLTIPNIENILELCTGEKKEELSKAIFNKISNLNLNDDTEFLELLKDLRIILLKDDNSTILTNLGYEKSFERTIFISMKKKIEIITCLLKENQEISELLTYDLEEKKFSKKILKLNNGGTLIMFNNLSINNNGDNKIENCFPLPPSKYHDPNIQKSNLKGNNDFYISDSVKLPKARYPVLDFQIDYVEESKESYSNENVKEEKFDIQENHDFFNTKEKFFVKDFKNLNLKDLTKDKDFPKLPFLEKVSKIKELLNITSISCNSEDANYVNLIQQMLEHELISKEELFDYITESYLDKIYEKEIEQIHSEIIEEINKYGLKVQGDLIRNSMVKNNLIDKEQNHMLKNIETQESIKYYFNLCKSDLKSLSYTELIKEIISHIGIKNDFEFFDDNYNFFRELIIKSGLFSGNEVIEVENELLTKIAN